MSKKSYKRRRRERIRASKQKSRKKPRWRWVATGLVLAVLAFLGVRQLLTIGWPTIKGSVLRTLSVQLPTSRAGGGRAGYALTVFYQYTVDGVTYRAQQMHEAKDRSAFRRLKRRFSGRIDVHYAPKDAALSTLSRMSLPVRGTRFEVSGSGRLNSDRPKQ